MKFRSLRYFFVMAEDPDVDPAVKELLQSMD